MIPPFREESNYKGDRRISARGFQALNCYGIRSKRESFYECCPRASRLALCSLLLAADAGKCDRSHMKSSK